MIAVLIQQMVLISSVFFPELFNYAPNIYFQEICRSNYNRLSAANSQHRITTVKKVFSHSSNLPQRKYNKLKIHSHSG